MNFRSFTDQALTNATCVMRQTYVEADAFCQATDCEAKRIRNSTLPHNATDLLLMDLDSCAAGMQGFLDGFVKSAEFMALYTTTTTDPYSIPIEFYFNNPDSPYSASYDSHFRWRGADIYPVADQLFSERFSQLWNTWWLSMIAPFAVTGNFSSPSIG